MPKKNAKNGRGGRAVSGRQLRTFVSYCQDDQQFVHEVCDHLGPYLGRESMFLFKEHPTLQGHYLDRLRKEMRTADLFLVFVGAEFGPNMINEAVQIRGRNRIVVLIDIGRRLHTRELPEIVQKTFPGQDWLRDQYSRQVPPNTAACARDILGMLAANAKDPKAERLQGLNLNWKDENLRYGLPRSPQVFDYEKDIIRFYVATQCHAAIAAAQENEDGAPEAEKLSLTFREVLDAWPHSAIRAKWAEGIPHDWPTVWRHATSRSNALLTDKHRGTGSESHLRVNALLSLDASAAPLVLLEAGPRPKLALPRREALKVAVVVSGGIAPGINAVIDAIVQRHQAYEDASDQSGDSYDLKILGLKNGFRAITGGAIRWRPLQKRDTVEHATKGGSILGTSRDEQLMSTDPAVRTQRIDEIAKELRNAEIDVLYVIGGDGSMKAAHALWQRLNNPSKQDSARAMSVVAIPKTMDNDILWVWQSFGFLTAVQEAREIIERMHTEVRSNPRLGIVQFFGSASGFVVSHAVLAAATGHTTLALIPEVDFSVLGVARYIKERLWGASREEDDPNPAAPIDNKLPHGLIVMAETAIPVDALQCLGLAPAEPHLERLYAAVTSALKPTEDERRVLREFFDNDRRVRGQTDDLLRNLGVRLLYDALPVLLQHDDLQQYVSPQGVAQPDWKKVRMVRNEPRYLVRALEPSTSDIITGQRLGNLAVDAAMAGFTDCMVSQWLTEFSIVPLDLVVLGRKRIPASGMFWTSVTSKTGQPTDLVTPFKFEGGGASQPGAAPAPTPKKRKTKVAGPSPTRRRLPKPPREAGFEGA